MISFQGVSKSLPKYLRYLHEQQGRLLRKAYSKKSASSSSSSSSDSDSDKTADKKKKQPDKASTEDVGKAFDISNTNARLNSLLEKITKAHAEKKINGPKPSAINVAIKPRKERFKKDPGAAQSEKSFEESVKVAANDVAKSLGGDTQKTELELLSQILGSGESKVDANTSDKEGTSGVPGSLDDLLTKMKIEEPEELTDTRGVMIDRSRKRMAKNLDQRLREPSIASSILSNKMDNTRKRYQVPSDNLLKNYTARLGVFSGISDGEGRATQLPIWEALQQKELNLAVLTTPQNVFQELIKWTEEGKLWHFPINNEQGMEEDAKVHFSEHVFLEKHLKDWCPKRGPIRHFMELVCTGLSKNPYMTVEEKIGHITWYKNYFEDKRDLLNDLNILDDKAVTNPDSKKGKIKA